MTTPCRLCDAKGIKQIYDSRGYWIEQKFCDCEHGRAKMNEHSERIKNRQAMRAQNKLRGTPVCNSCDVYTDAYVDAYM